MNFLGFLLDGVRAVTWQQAVMWIVGGTLIYLAISRDYEPALLLPIGFGAILVNIPYSSMINQDIPGYKMVEGIIDFLFEKGIKTELFPLLLFVGIGAMIDFGPLLSNPKMLFFGAAAQFGIFGTLLLATAFGFSVKDAASVGIIGAADGPTSIFVANFFDSQYVGPIMVAAYSYMALVPIIQPFAIKLVTTRKERMIRMPYHPRNVSKTTRILFPIGVSFIAGLIAPSSLSLIGMIMFGNLIRESGVLNSLSKTAQTELSNLVTMFLGITIAASMKADAFVNPRTLLILGLGLLAFVFDTVFGVFFVKFLNLFTKNKMNPMVGAAGISAFPMSARVIHKMALKEDPQNFLLMHTVGANVAGQIASVIAGGLIIYLLK
ncbi:MAG: sodium ion-translocating decarboxylase subunit beta [Saccharofermentanales bacterium]